MSNPKDRTGVPLKSKISEESSFKISQMKEIIKPTKLHRHANYHEFILLTQGSGSHEIDDTVYEVMAPVAYYLRPGQAHCWNFSSIPKGFVILIKEELLLKEDIDLLYTLPGQILVTDSELLFKLASDLYQEFKSNTSTSAIYQAYIHLLTVKLKHASGLQNPIPPALGNLFQKYKRLVNDHYLQYKQVSFYAEQLHMSSAALNEVCKKSVGKTASTLISERILLEAKMLLSATDRSISEIAHLLDFSDSPHFINFFKLRTKLTPGAYRTLALHKK